MKEGRLMLYVDLFLLFYVLVGFVLACFIDRSEMKQHVPYGNVPAVLSLSVIRRIVFGFCIILGLPMILTGLSLALIEDVRYRVWEWHMERKLRSICKQIGLNYDAMLNNHYLNEKREKHGHTDDRTRSATGIENQPEDALRQAKPRGPDEQH